MNLTSYIRFYHIEGMFGTQRFCNKFNEHHGSLGNFASFHGTDQNYSEIDVGILGENSCFANFEIYKLFERLENKVSTHCR